MTYKILVVEDERVERESTALTIQLHLTDVQVVDQAENGIQAVEMFSQTHYDVVIMDIDLPGYSGLETISKMQELSKNTRYIVLSAYKIFDYAQSAMKLGVVEYLLKPCSARDLIGAIREAAVQLEESPVPSGSSDDSGLMPEIRPVLESDCVFALTSLRSGEQLEARFQILQEIPGQGVTFVVSSEMAQRKILTTVKKGLQRMGVTAIGEAIHNQCVFVILGDVAHGPGKLEHIAGFLSQMLQEEMTCFLGFGRISDNVEQMVTSYQEALRALNDAIVHHQPYVLYTEAVAGAKQDDISVRELGRDLLHHIRAQEHQKIAQSMQDMFAQWVCDGYTRSQVDSGIYRLWLTVASGMADVISDDLLEEFTLQKIRCYGDLAGLCKKLTDCLVDISVLILGEEGQTRQNNQLVKRAVTIIHQQYMENISLNQVASQLAITPFYLSKLVKRRTGRTFTDYLTLCRIERAKELLEENQLSIKEVTYAVGFNSQNYFAKIFKKHTNLSPTEYRAGGSNG